MRVLLLACGLTVVTAEALFQRLDDPFIPTLVATALLMSLACWRSRGGARVVAANLATIALVLLGFELWVIAREPASANRSDHTGTYVDGYFLPQVAERGFGPTPNRASSSRKVIDGDVIYDVTYSIDRHGLRVTPASDADSSVVFFGCSFTFGEGLNDEDTIPFRVGEAVRETARVYNFGFHGYGPHQMLATLNGTFIDGVIEAPPKVIVFVTGDFQIDRVIGRLWDRQGPRFRLDDKGEVYRDGTFADVRFTDRIARSLRVRISASRLGSRFVRRFVRGRGENFSLYVGIVVAARDRARERYPSSRFEVLVWDRASPLNERMLEAFETAGIATHRVSEALPGLEQDPHPYEIHEMDGHPNPYATRLVADYVVRSILR